MARIDKKSLMIGSKKEDKPQRTAVKAAKRNTEGKIRFRNFKRYLSVSQRSLWLLILLVLISCRSVPKSFDEVILNEGFLPLENGASVYVIADVKEARPLIELMPIEELNDRQTRQMLDRTDYLAAALFNPESGKRFQLAVWGNYPSSQAGLAFSANKEWKKQRSASGSDYWHSSSNMMSISMNKNQAFIVSSLKDTLIDPVTSPPGIEIPESFIEFRKDSPLALWMENPGTAVMRLLADTGLPLRFPLQSLFVNILPLADNKYEALIRMQFENTSHARSMAALLSMAANFIGDDPSFLLAALFFANPPVQNGSALDIKTAPLGAEEIARLFSIFL